MTPTDHNYHFYIQGGKDVDYLRQNMHAHTDLILFMTWGRRNKSTQHTNLNGCYADMQDNLKVGYESYRDQGLVTNAGPVYIAPVGLAFKAIHDKYCTDGLSTPECTGQMSGVSVGCEAATDGTTNFTTLYSGDSSHPSPKGSYLAACVCYATITGKSPEYLTGPAEDDVSLEDRLYLQQVAADVVFKKTPDYDYPWQSNPINDPTLPPTVTKSSEPTRAPVPDPTRAPVSDPTKAPVPDPTRTPVPDTTRAPVPVPTRAPVPDPTRASVPDSTRQPVYDPTRPPVSDPTRSPDPDPEISAYLNNPKNKPP